MPIDAFISYRKSAREEARKKALKEKRRLEKIDKLKSYCHKTTGYITEIRLKALKIFINELSKECWIPKYSIKVLYEEKLELNQED